MMKRTAVRRPRRILITGTFATGLLLGGALAGCSTDSTSAGIATSLPTALPHDFPGSDVPLVDGKLVRADGNAASGWRVTVFPVDMKGGFAAAKNQLTASGFTATSTKWTSVRFAGSKYDVLLTSPRVAVNYTVTRTRRFQ